VKIAPGTAAKELQMEAFVARHPIFDEANKVYGYDLEFRSGFAAFYDTAADEKEEVDLQLRASFEGFAGLGKAHVLIPGDLLRKEVPARLPAETLIVGLPADLPAEPELIQACRKLRQTGYELSLDDVGPARCQGPLLELAGIARLDTRMAAPGERQELCDKLIPRGIRILAKNVDTPEALAEAKEAGCRYFQGEYFRKPVIRPGKEVTTTELNYLRVLNEVNKPELAYDELDALIKQDVSIAYKLLRFINSAWYGLKIEVKSIRHALVLLGPAEVRVWASLLVLRDMGRQKPEELFRRCLARARMAELMAPFAGLEARAAELFLTGMFSLVDALTDCPMEDVLAGLPVSRPIKAALLCQTGQFAAVYQTVLSYELGEWDLLSASAAAIPIDENALPQIATESRKWAEEALNIL